MSNQKRLAEQKKSASNARKFRNKLAVTVNADWELADAEQLRSTVGAVTRAGGALRLGCTRDGGAYSIGVYGDGPEPYTEYVRPNEDLNEFLADLEQVFVSLQGENKSK